MPTTRRPMSGRAKEGAISKLDKYNKDSKASAVGTFMRTFSRTKISQMISTWDDVQYLNVFNAEIKCLADATSAIDSATVPDPGLLALIDIAWETHFTNANLKDLVSADETAWKSYFAAYLQLALDLQITYNFRCLLPAYTESDIVPGNYSNITYLSQSSYDILLASLAQYPAPKGVYEIVDAFATWIVQLSQEYERFTIRIPAMHFSPFTCTHDLGDFEGMRDCLRLNLGGFITHAKKFGLGMGTWRDPVPPRMVGLSDPNVIAYFNHSHFDFYDKTANVDSVNPDGGFMGADLATDYTGTEYFFKDTPNESILHVLAPWFGVYDGTNNPYGGLIRRIAPASIEYHTNLMSVAQHGDNVAEQLLTSDGAKIIMPLFKAYADGQSAIFIRTINGTNFTAAQNIGGGWGLASMNALFMGLGRGATETNNDLINYIGTIIT